MTKGKTKSKVDPQEEKCKDTNDTAIVKSMEKEKKKKKRKRSDDKEEKLKMNNSDVKVKKKEKKKKKRKRTSSTEPKKKDDDETTGPRKEKKMQNDKPKEDPPISETETPLEGSMVGDLMVLIDRKKAKVYSGTERLENGDRQEIGTVSKDGSIVMHKTEGKDKATPEFPFDTDADDHCESPKQAYQDIVPFLKDCAKVSSPDKMVIYDPYYCDGTVVQNLTGLGFSNVYNRKEDCYQVWGTSRYPNHDLLVTNPPYSGNHIERLINHITSKSFGNRPWMLLLPQWVHKKDYYIAKTKHIKPFYVVPKKRYVYLPPPSFRESKKSDVHKKSSPFVSMWYIWGGSGTRNEQWMSTLSRQISTCDVARSKSSLRDLRRKGGGSKKK